ncbi:hypothetical protein [Zobellella sp. An-6]|uniref:hypothetical protein n=1 Tax=Zobellella sp. An-6 TaxID=3400218 RepID=UPI004042A667
MKLLQVIMVSMLTLVTGCAQVPKEAVELSATVGRDLAEMRKSHTALVKIYYEGLIKNVNQFVDNVYLPYQIQRALSDDAIKKDMLTSIEAASMEDVTGKKQKDAYQKLQYFHLIIHEEVDSYRKTKLSPINEQYKSVLNGINESYEKIHYANSIVTGHLASIVKVHDAQNEILEKLDLKDLRTKVGVDVVNISDEIAGITYEAKENDSDLEEIIAKFEELVKIVR